MALRETATSGDANSRDVEAGLIGLAVEGDEGAFTELYDTQHDRVFRHVYYRVGRVEDAEDLTQKVFLQAWRTLGRYRHTGVPFVGWLLAIAHNVMVSFLRARRPTEVALVRRSAPVELANLGLAMKHYDSQPLIREAIRGLGPDRQFVVTLRFLEGFDYREIAAIMGKSEEAVRVIQCRALQRQGSGRDADRRPPPLGATAVAGRGSHRRSVPRCRGPRHGGVRRV